jgi:hypothetical protein
MGQNKNFTTEKMQPAKKLKKLRPAKKLEKKTTLKSIDLLTPRLPVA